MDSALTLPAKIAVLAAPQAARPAMLDLAARLAPAGPLRVLDGGNHFNAYVVARAVRRQTARLDEALANIRVARAFTCYQMLALLAETQASPIPTLVLDLLCTFYDENVPLYETRRLLQSVLAELARLAQRGPVMVSTRPPARFCPERIILLDDLREALPVYFSSPALPPAASQPTLFNLA